MELHGDCSIISVVCGNATAEPIGEVLVPYAEWMGLRPGEEQPSSSKLYLWPGTLQRKVHNSRPDLASWHYWVQYVTIPQITWQICKFFVSYTLSSPFRFVVFFQCNVLGLVHGVRGYDKAIHGTCNFRLSRWYGFCFHFVLFFQAILENPNILIESTVVTVVESHPQNKIRSVFFPS